MVVQLVALLFCTSFALTTASDTSVRLQISVNLQSSSLPHLLQTVIRQLGNAQRDIMVIGMLRSRFLLIVGPLSHQAGQPIDIRDVYIFDLPPKAFSNGKLALSNGVKMSDKWPQMSQLFGLPLFTMQDDTSEYIFTMTPDDYGPMKKIFNLNTGMVQSVYNNYRITVLINTIVYISNDKKASYDYYFTCSNELDEINRDCPDLPTCPHDPDPIARYFCYADGYLQMSHDQKKCQPLEDCLQMVAGFVTDKRIYLFTNTTMMYSFAFDIEAPDGRVKLERIHWKAFFVEKPASAALAGILIAVLLIGLLTALAIVYCCYRSKWACCRRVSKSLQSHSSHKRRHSSHKLKRHATGKTRKTRKTHKKHSGQKLKAKSLKH